MDAFIKNPDVVLQDMLHAGIKKKQLDFVSLVLKAVFAGVFVALGAASSSAATYGISNTGLAKTLSGVIFPVGLMLVLLLGGELFTSNALMLFGKMTGSNGWRNIIKTLCVVFVGNMIGSIIIAFMVFGSGQLDYSEGMLGAYAIKIAVAKVTHSPLQLYISAILCNVLVCLAVLMGNTAKDVVGKIFAVFFPIMAFVIGGYEHCVANMYYIPVGILAATSEKYREMAIKTYGITAAQIDCLNIKSFFLVNLIPVTLGNLVGGMVLIAIPFYIIYGKKEEAIS